MTNRFLKHKDYIPFLVLAVLSVITAVVYTLTAQSREALTYLKLLSTALIPLLAPLTSNIFRVNVPVKLNALVCVHIFCAIHLGTCFAFYSRIAWWDLFLHGYFGLLATAIIFDILPKDMLCTRRASALSILLTVLATLGLGGLWEIFEFTTDMITGADAQCVVEAINNGRNPIADTMTDLIITVVGSAVYLVFLFIYRKLKKKR